MELISFALPQTGNFLVDIIKWLIQISSSIAVGVILFTLILKFITLPFDFFSRVSMRKNSLKMEQMRPELEKLQKQYANDKALYNQKMMALYKKNGYSMWGSCLPTIITLVIFIVAINAFTAYSEFQNREYFYNMSTSYNNAIYSGLETDGEYIKLSNGTYKIDYKGIYEKFDKTDVGVAGTPDIKDENNVKTTTIITNYTQNNFDSNGVSFVLDKTKTDVETVTTPAEGEPTTVTKTTYKMAFYTTNGYIKHIFNYTLNTDKVSETNPDGFVLGSAETFEVVADRLSALSGTTTNKLNNDLKIKRGNKTYTFDEVKGFDQETYNKEFGLKADTVLPTEDVMATAFVKDIAQEKSAETYRSVNKSFLWVKNIWVTDSPIAHPIVGDWKTFKDTYKYNDQGDRMSNADYDNLVAKLSQEKTEPNGYFILAILTAGISFLTQWVMSKSQKSQMELQTVDGQGAKTQKMMMWIMPIMMAFFSFMYTAAFSIYMFISSVFSILTTLGINWIVDKRFAKKNANANDDKVHGRVYVPEEKPEPKKEKKVKEKKKSKPENNGKDFMSGDGKHIRGRLK